MDSARIGSAFRLAWAAAIGAAPRMISPRAPTEAIVPRLAVATLRRREAGRTRARQPAADAAGLAVAGSVAGSVTGAVAGVSARYPLTARRTNGIMLFGSVPSPPKKPK